MTVRLFVVLFKRAFVELLQAKSANEMLRVKFLAHGSDATACEKIKLQCKMLVHGSVPFKRKKSANLRNYVRRIRSYKSTVRKKSPAVFGNFFILLKFLQFC